MDGSAGATIDDETGEMKVKRETVMTAAHFFLSGQFLGFSGSSGPSQVTYRGVNNDIIQVMISTYQFWVSPIGLCGSRFLQPSIILGPRFEISIPFSQNSSSHFEHGRYLFLIVTV